MGPENVLWLILENRCPIEYPFRHLILSLVPLLGALVGGVTRGCYYDVSEATGDTSGSPQGSWMRTRHTYVLPLIYLDRPI